MVAKKKDRRTWTIYGLRCEGETAIRYVGQTTRKLNQRLAGHLRQEAAPLVAAWVKELALAGKYPEAIPLATATNRGEAFVVERMWIQSMSFVFGDLLLNTFNRGDFVSLNDLRLAAARESRRIRYERYSHMYDKGWRRRKRRIAS